MTEHPLPSSVAAFSAISKGFWIPQSKRVSAAAATVSAAAQGAEMARFNFATWK